jgi:hypothetical protein
VPDEGLHRPVSHRLLSPFPSPVLDGGRIVHLGSLEELSRRIDLPFARTVVEALG